MTTRVNVRDVSRYSWSVPKRFAGPGWHGLKLVAVASALHVFLAFALFIAGRAQLAPTLINRDGIIESFAHDSYGYQAGAIQLAGHLRSGEFASWAAADQPVHVK